VVDVAPNSLRKVTDTYDFFLSNRFFSSPRRTQTCLFLQVKYEKQSPCAPLLQVLQGSSGLGQQLQLRTHWRSTEQTGAASALHARPDSVGSRTGEGEGRGEALHGCQCRERVEREKGKGEERPSMAAGGEGEGQRRREWRRDPREPIIGFGIFIRDVETSESLALSG
jgi:hypothetical protein